ncbi:hypothetical protein M0813_02289 [Anaeramoeba flamelloides]|uniref:Uncharacterized protein n=1 Tax=Anaeramoeba flamelloides TaxID=1746091 RepID=A0ABQ8YKN5_9EUKA|nr:hypothetical protein M0813_02289 [Anaeramoeba flamelloides]
MQNSSKPFPHNLNPIFLETTNWVLKEMIQTKKTLAKKNKKNIWCVWHGQTCSKLNSVQYSHQMHGGSQFLCKNCYDLWYGWNNLGNPIIKTWEEWLNELNDQESSESDTTNTDTDSEYKDDGEDEENGKETSNLTHQPSYNEEELRIYRMTEEANGRELQTKIFEKQEQEKREKRRRKKK